jgi:hypothetical protein
MIAVFIKYLYSVNFNTMDPLILSGGFILLVTIILILILSKSSFSSSPSSKSPSPSPSSKSPSPSPIVLNQVIGTYPITTFNVPLNSTIIFTSARGQWYVNVGQVTTVSIDFSTPSFLPDTYQVQLKVGTVFSNTITVTVSPLKNSSSTSTMKKGFVYDLKNNPLFDTQMKSLNLGWYYTWGLQGSSTLTGIPFTPMIWGLPDAGKLSQIPTGSKEILAFNEPDGNQAGAQSNIRVHDVVSAWPALKATGLRIGSVASSQNPLSSTYIPHDGSATLTTSYFDALWTQLTAANMQPDFIALHWYAPPDANGFLSWIDSIHAKYGKPIWITEMCVADWNATTSSPEKYSTSQIQTFMDSVVAGMNYRSYVERYTWKTRPTNDINMGNGSLIAADGTLTPLGVHYASL